MKNVNIELHEFFLSHSEWKKPELERSIAFETAYDQRCEILDLELSDTKENKLLRLLKKKVINDMKTESLNNELNELINNITK
tara:strand:- start:134 stop:382 length:249 start_codon:yes stop_codon:yes gene_type:complete